MRLLVTGATGFIGRHLVKRLSRRHQVIVTAHINEDVIAGVAVVPWDFSKPMPVDLLPDSVDGIVHLAQSRNYRDFPGAALDMLDINVTAAIRLADYARRVNARHFCLISSGSVFEPFTGPLVEDASLAPTSFHGASKLAAEVLLHPFRAYMSVFVPRLFFPYGPHQTDRLLSNLVECVRRDRPIVVDPDGIGPRICPIYIDDVVDILMTGIEGNWCGVFNVGGPWSIGLRDIGQVIGRILDRTPRFEIADRSPAAIVPDLGRLRALYPLEGLIDIETGLRRMIEASGPE